MLAVGMLLMFFRNLLRWWVCGSNEQGLLSVLSAMISLAGFVRTFFLDFQWPVQTFIWDFFFDERNIPFVSAREILPLPLRDFKFFLHRFRFFCVKDKEKQVQSFIRLHRDFSFYDRRFPFAFFARNNKNAAWGIMGFPSFRWYSYWQEFSLWCFSFQRLCFKLMPSDISFKAE